MSELNDMTCAELPNMAAELALGVLTGRDRAIAIAHLDKCESCREDVRQLMATGEQLLQLLPSAEPPAGFETRVLERLGLPVPVPGEASGETSGDTYPQLISPRESTVRQRRPDERRPGAGQPGAPPARPRGAGRMRRALAATAVGLAVIAAGLGGWGIGVGTTPARGLAAGPLTVADLFSPAHQEVGNIFLYSGRSRWVYMSVELKVGDQLVTCEVVGTDGRVTALGSFHMKNGSGVWGSPDPDNLGALSGAQIISADGSVLATATFA